MGLGLHPGCLSSHDAFDLGYLNMNPPQMEKVIADCDEALKHDKRYEKALNRRAGALEQLGRYEESLRGVSHFASQTKLSLMALLR